MTDGQQARLIRLRIKGMGCDGCIRSVRQALEAVPGVRRADVDLQQGTATVEGTSAIDPAGLIAAVDEAGYEAAIA